MESVAELVAGRELDALVAERVMGWLLHRSSDILYTGNDGITIQDYWTRDSEDNRETVPHYSTDIGDAWTILGKFTSFKIEHEGEVWGRTTCRLHWWADGKPQMTEVEINGDSVPLAICRAALQAVEISGGK